MLFFIYSLLTLILLSLSLSHSASVPDLLHIFFSPIAGKLWCFESTPVLLRRKPLQEEEQGTRDRLCRCSVTRNRSKRELPTESRWRGRATRCQFGCRIGSSFKGDRPLSVNSNPKSSVKSKPLVPPCWNNTGSVVAGGATGAASKDNTGEA